MKTMLRRPADLTSADFPLTHRPCGEFSEVELLLALCASGRLYEVETWIAEGRPIQFPPPEDRKLLKRSTALQIAVKQRFHSLAALLLANGYDPNGDYYECLSPAVEAKDHDMVELLLQFGANPQDVDFCIVLETRDRALMDRFMDAGVDPCRCNAVARALESSGRPILGFVKQYRERFPCLQRQIDIALRAATEAENPRRIALMLWLGADPHAKVAATAYEDEREDTIDDTAFENALWAHQPEILAQFLKRPIPKDRVQALLFRVSYRSRPDLVRRLLDEGADPNAMSDEGDPVLHGFISSLLWRFRKPSVEEEAAGMEALELMLKSGAKWSLAERQLKSFRRDLVDGESKIVIQLLGLLHKYDVFTPAQLHELTRTPAMRKVLSGLSKPRRDPFASYYTPPAPVVTPVQTPPRRGYWKRHWSQR